MTSFISWSVMLDYLARYVGQDYASSPETYRGGCRLRRAPCFIHKPYRSTAAGAYRPFHIAHSAYVPSGMFTGGCSASASNSFTRATQGAHTGVPFARGTNTGSNVVIAL